MAIKQQEKRGFVLLIAIIFMSVMLSFALTLGSLSYKQQVLTSAAIESQYAFYAASSGLECALYADQKLNNFSYLHHGAEVEDWPAIIACSGSTIARQYYEYNETTLIDVQRISLEEGKRCADVTVYKYASPAPGDPQTAIYAQGYNLSCTVVASPGGERLVSRGVRALY